MQHSDISLHKLTDIDVRMKVSQCSALNRVIDHRVQHTAMDSGHDEYKTKCSLQHMAHRAHGIALCISNVDRWPGMVASIVNTVDCRDTRLYNCDCTS